MKKISALLGCLFCFVTATWGGAQNSSRSMSATIAGAIQENWEALGRKGNIEGGYWRLLSLEIEGQRNGKPDGEEMAAVEQPKPVAVNKREDGKYDIEIALHSISNPLSVDYLETGYFAAAFAYGFSGFYLSFLGVQGDTFWGTPLSNPMYSQFYSGTNSPSGLVSQEPRAINPKLVGKLTYDFYDLETSDTTYDGLGKVAEKAKIKVHLIGKIVLRGENASKVSWAHWDKVDVKAFGKLCEFYGPDGQAVQPKVKGVESEESETPEP